MSTPSFLDFKEGDTGPTTPGTDRRLLYPKADGWYQKDDAGVEALLVGVPASRTITTTLPLTGGGTLAANLTLDINNATAALDGAMAAADFVKLHGIWKDIVADFGADPTGGVNATSIIQTAVDSFGSNGGVLYFPPGTYLVNGTITITKPVIIKGAGRSISNITTSHATADVIIFSTGSNGGGMEQIRVSANAEALRTGGDMVDFGIIPNVYMQQCDIIYPHTGVHSSGPLQFLDDLNIREIGENASNGQAVLVDGTGDRYIRRLTTDSGPGDATGVAAIRVRRCSSLVISDCNLINGGNALDLVANGGGGTALASVLCVNTFFDSSAIGCNIAPATSSDTVHRIRFINCWFSTCTTAGVSLGVAGGGVPNANIDSVSFIACDFYDNPIGLEVLSGLEWDVRSSRFAGNDTGAGTGIRVAPGPQTNMRFSITDSFIGDGAGFGPNLVGINVTTGTYGRYQILDNRGLESNTTTPGVVDAGVVGPTGQKNVKNNMGAVLAGAQQPLSSGGAALIAGRGAITSGTAETFLMTFRVPANAVAVGQVFKLTMHLQAQGAGTLIFRIRSGAAGTIAADTEISINPASTVSVANQYYLVSGLVTVAALGPTATVAGSHTVFANAVYIQKTAAAEFVANTPTTAAWFITLSATASASTFTVREVALEAL